MMISALLAVALGPSTVYDFKVNDIDGTAKELSAYKGKVLLIVNTASKCGLTPQYAGLEALFRAKKEKGLVILGFPANNFNGQEPGTEAQIKQFCTGTYDVTFPMFSKISVKGEGIHPLYQWLIDQTPPAKDVEWNFAKFLVGRDGKVIKRFSPQTKPDAAELTAAIDQAL
jgi:glutathione peroxidase